MRIGLAILATCLLVLPAQAGFKVCNKSPREAKVAFGHFDGKDWSSEGWWTLAPRTCQNLLTGPLEARFYYLYATDGGAGSWDGKRGFCVAQSNNFKIRSRANCAGHGYDRKGFFEIDTGEARDYTQNLSD